MFSSWLSLFQALTKYKYVLCAELWEDIWRAFIIFDVMCANVSPIKNVEATVEFAEKKK